MWSREFLLTGLDGSWRWLLFLGVCFVVAAALIVSLMRYERQLVSRKVGLLLMTLRFGVLALLLLVFLGPVLAWDFDNTRDGRILLAIDVSESMDIPDEHATGGEKLRWARALGLIGNDSTAARLDRWQAAFDANEEPEWVADDEASSDEVRAELEASRREQLNDAFEKLDGMSRREFARRILLAGKDALLPGLEEIGQVDVVLFGGSSLATETETLDDVLRKDEPAAKPELSDLRQPVLSVTTSAEESPVLGVVMLTDGRDNAGGEPGRFARQLGYAETPLYPIVLGSRFRPKDLSVAFIDHPQTVLQDDKPVVKAMLQTSGFEDEPLVVRLEAEGEMPIEKIVTPRGSTLEVEFELDADDLGRKEYTVTLPEQEGETRDDNNSRSFAMTVVDDRVQVLLLDGSARWEFRYVEIALDRDERVEVSKVVFNQPYIGILNDTFFPREFNLPAGEIDPSQTPLADVDLIVIGDVAPEDLPPNFWPVIEKWVSDVGGTICFSAGKSHMPLAYGNVEVVQNLLPVRNLRELNIDGAGGFGDPVSRGFHLSVTPEGEREVIFQFDSDPTRQREVWSNLPGHFWGLVGEAKPGATTYVTTNRERDAADLAGIRENALFVHQHYGSGQVLWIGLDSTWRWRHRRGDAFHHRFWGQLGRWAVENKAMAGNDLVKLILPDNEVESGEDAVIEAKFVRKALQDSPDAKVRAEISTIDDPDTVIKTVDLKEDESRPLVRSGRALGLKPGEYRVRLVTEDLRGDEGEEPLEAYLSVRDTQTLELLDLSANRKLLQEMANVSRGRLLEPNEARQVLSLLTGVEDESSLREEFSFWDHWAMLVLFFGLLTTEWVVRKLNGLP